MKKKKTQDRELAKAGMAASLGTLFVTGLCRFKYARLLHPWAGVMLLGFTLWHHSLNKSKRKDRIAS
jgi:hypothetical protein